MKHFVFKVALMLVMAGCGAENGGKFLPVKGRVTAGGAPLTTGSVTFHPDAAKGNTSPHIPVGTLDGEGRYELMSATKQGAPTGWYKVSVHAQAPIDAKNPYARPKELIPARYTDGSASGIAVEVTATHQPGAYDFDLTK